MDREKSYHQIIEMLEHAYSGAKMMDDEEFMLRASRALAAFQASTEKEIFKEEFLDEYCSNL